MLIRTLKLEDKIMIGDEVQVQFLGFEGARAKVGITAPPDVKILPVDAWKRERGRKGER